MLDEIKAVADGVIASAQWNEAPDPVGVDRLAQRLARAGIEADAESVRAALVDAALAGMGRCTRLIASDGRLTPDDHRVVAGIVSVRQVSAGPVRLEAHVYNAVRVPAL